MEKQHLTRFAGSAAKRSFPYRLAGLVNLDLAALQPSGMFLMPVTLRCQICNKEYSVIPSRAKTSKYCDYTCHQIGVGRLSGESRRGTGKKHPYIKFHGRHLHRVLAEKAIGRPLTTREVVHHADHNTKNNHTNNLNVITQSEHIRCHIYDMLKARRIRHGY